MSSPGPASPSAKSQSKRGMAVTTLLLVVSAALLWSASRMTWVDYTSADGLRPPVDASLNGGEWAPALTPLALLLIAGIAAMFAVKGVWVRVVGALLGLAGIAAAALGVLAVAGDTDRAQVLSIAELSAGTQVTAATMQVFPVLLTILAGVLAVVAAVPLVLGRFGRTGLSSSYETPAARKAAAKETAAKRDNQDLQQRQIWDALDAGADPTDDDHVSRDHPETRDN